MAQVSDDAVTEAPLSEQQEKVQKLFKAAGVDGTSERVRHSIVAQGMLVLATIILAARRIGISSDDIATVWRLHKGEVASWVRAGELAGMSDAELIDAWILVMGDEPKNLVHMLKLLCEKTGGVWQQERTYRAFVETTDDRDAFHAILTEAGWNQEEILNTATNAGDLSPEEFLTGDIATLLNKAGLEMY